MLDPVQDCATTWSAQLRAAVRRVPVVVRQMWRVIRHKLRGDPVEVLVTDRSRRLKHERDIRSAMRRLRHVLGRALPAHAAVIVQQVVVADHPIVGCYHLGQRPDGATFVLIRLALEVAGRPLTSDELLANLAEQCIAVAMQHDGALSVVVPLDLALPRRSDPLAPSTNGHAAPTPQRIH
ncbi:MAG: hypothetical protein U0822_08185 [Anaerolineae bacterium]